MKNSTVFALTVAAVSALVAVPAALAGDNGPPIFVRVPEPGTLALIGTGAAVLAARAWWRNRK